LVAASSALVLILCAGAVAANFRSSAGYVIGAKNFPEQYILATLIDQRLTAAGLNSSTRSDLGSAIIFRALTAGDIDIYVDYTGTIWTNEMHRSDTPARNIVLADVSAWVREHYGARVLGPLGFENAYVLAMQRNKAQSLGVKSIADLASVSPAMTVGGDYEIFRRPEWQQLHAAYRLDFKDERQMQPLFMYKAVADGDVDAITAFSSDGRIAQYGLVTLADPKHVIPPYDAILLLSPKRSNDRALISALQPLIGKIDVEKMRRANLAVSRDDNPVSPATAARQLWKEISGGGSSE